MSPQSSSSDLPGHRESPGRGDRLREWRLRLVLLAISLAVTFVCGEIVLRLLARGAPRPVASESGFTFFSYHERLGWDLVPNAVDRHKTEEFEVEIRIDARGLRSAHDHVPGLTPGVRRLVVLGDSFTFGHGVEAKEAWPALLEGQLAQSEAPNLAVTGYGTDQQLLRFEERAIELQPDAVILGLFAGNVFRNARFEQLGYSKPRFAFDDGQLQLLGVPVPEQPPPPPFSRLWGLMGGTLKSVGEHLGYGEAWRVTGGILDRLAERSEAFDAPLFVVILPKDRMIYGGGPRRAVHERMHARLHALLEARDLPYLDLTRALREQAAASTERLYYPRDGHWTTAGHQVAASAVAGWLGPQLPEPPDLEPASPETPNPDSADPITADSAMSDPGLSEALP